MGQGGGRRGGWAGGGGAAGPKGPLRCMARQNAPPNRLALASSLEAIISSARLAGTDVTYLVFLHSIMGAARGCPGSTCISPVWLERSNISI